MAEMNEGQRQAQVVFLSWRRSATALGRPRTPGHGQLHEKLPDLLKKPEAILMISAHWEEPTATLLGAKTRPCSTTITASPSRPIKCNIPFLAIRSLLPTDRNFAAKQHPQPDRQQPRF